MLTRFFLISLTLTLFLSPGSSRAGISATMNLDRIREAALQLSDSLLAQDDLSATVCLNIVDHPADWIVEHAITEVGARIGRPVEECLPPFRNELLIAILDVGVRYVELDDEDFFRREIDLSVSASMPRISGDGRVERHTRRVDVVVVDTIESINASSLEQSDYPMTVAQRIERSDSSFWRRIAEPAIVIGTAVVMLVLLFTTRSQ